MKNTTGGRITRDMNDPGHETEQIVWRSKGAVGVRLQNWVGVSFHSFFLLAALGLCCCAGFPLVMEGGGYSPAAVCKLLTAVASPAADHRLQRQGLQYLQQVGSFGLGALEHTGSSSCGVKAWLSNRMWDLPGPGMESTPPALAGGFLSTVPPGKPWG